MQPGEQHENPHDHSRVPAGDGTERSLVGYSLDDLRLPGQAGAPGRYSFRIDSFRGTPQTQFLTEQTKMHVYVVRDDSRFSGISTLRWPRTATGLVT